MARQIIDHIDFLDRSIATLTEQITERLGPFEPAVVLLCTIPGVGRLAAEVIVAETGGDMARFPTPSNCAPGPGWLPLTTSRRATPIGRDPPGAQWLRRTLIDSARTRSQAGKTAPVM